MKNSIFKKKLVPQIAIFCVLFASFPVDTLFCIETNNLKYTLFDTLAPRLSIKKEGLINRAIWGKSGELIFNHEERTSLDLENKGQLIKIINDDDRYKYLNPALLHNGILLARRISVDFDASKPHSSDIVRLFPQDKEGLEFKAETDKVLIDNAEDPRIMFVGGRLAMTFVRPSEEGTVWNSFLVFIDEYGNLKSEPVKIGRPGVNSKNTYLIELNGGRIALIDRANVPGQQPAIQAYFFDNLDAALSAPEGYWQKHFIEQAIILKAAKGWDHVGFNTIAARVKSRGKDCLMALVHYAKIQDNANKIYQTAVVLLDEDTLQPLGKPVSIHSIDPKSFSGDVKGVVYETGAQVHGDKLVSYAGFNDSNIIHYNESIKKLIAYFWEAQAAHDSDKEVKVGSILANEVLLQRSQQILNNERDVDFLILLSV